MDHFAKAKLGMADLQLRCVFAERSLRREPAVHILGCPGLQRPSHGAGRWRARDSVKRACKYLCLPLMNGVDAQTLSTLTPEVQPRSAPFSHLALCPRPGVRRDMPAPLLPYKRPFFQITLTPAEIQVFTHSSV